MFSFETQDVVLVRLAAAMDRDPVAVHVTKCEGKSYVSVTKNNKALHYILKKGVHDDSCKPWMRKLSNTNIMEQLKKLKDDKYEEALSQGPSKRSRPFKAFVLQLPETCIIHTPAIGDVASIEMTVRMSNLTCIKCQHHASIILYSVVFEVVTVLTSHVLDGPCYNI
jgi:hypothetical protein